MVICTGGTTLRQLLALSWMIEVIQSNKLTAMACNESCNNELTVRSTQRSKRDMKVKVKVMLQRTTAVVISVLLCVCVSVCVCVFVCVCGILLTV